MKCYINFYVIVFIVYKDFFSGFVTITHLTVTKCKILKRNYRPNYLVTSLEHI